MKQLLYYWVSSFVVAILSYYLLWLVLPGHNVFGSWYSMINYHMEYPHAFIAIPCFFYGIIAPLFSKSFLQSRLKKRLLANSFIILVVVFLSSPIGGMLWHFFDMKTGYFPKNWPYKLLVKGSVDGLRMGWLIIVLSIPYNLLGITMSFALTKKGSELFDKK